MVDTLFCSSERVQRMANGNKVLSVVVGNAVAGDDEVELGEGAARISGEEELSGGEGGSQVVGEELAGGDELGGEAARVSGEEELAGGDRVMKTFGNSEFPANNQIATGDDNTISASGNSNSPFERENLPEYIRFQEGLQAYLRGGVPSKKGAAVIAMMAESTFVH